MKLRTKLLALSLLTLLLPWSAWKLLQELEQFLRGAQENALLDSARTMAGVIPLGFQTRLMFLPGHHAPLRSLARAPALDGYADDWPDAGHRLVFSSDDGQGVAHMMAGAHDGRLFLFFDVRQEAAGAGRAQTGALTLQIRNPRGLFRFGIEPEAPGPLQLPSDQGPGQLEGFWLDREDGFRVELMLPVPAVGSDVSFRVHDGNPRAPGAVAGPPQVTGRDAWISLVPEWEEVSRWLTRTDLAAGRSWMVDPHGWVLADSQIGPLPAVEQGTQQTTWMQRSLYRLVAGSRTAILSEEWPPEPVRLDDEVVQAALRGEEASGWTQHPETAVVRNTVAVPIRLEGAPVPTRVYGALVMQSTSEGLLLMTNRALGRLLFTTLALTLGLAGGLWLFATRLSGRVQRLGSAVSRAMENRANPDTLPLVEDRDELGELARNNERLLRAVADYSQYLETLASKLSHELKTPLAITRSSLDNLSSRALDQESRRFLDRAQEGVARQSAIVRAMSEASRLEAAIGAADWEEVDLGKLLLRCAEGYRTVHPGRELHVRAPDDPQRMHVAPDLLAQALDKLVDNAMSLSSETDAVTLLLETAPGRIDLAVRNSGSRLPDELQERLFDSLVSVRERRGREPHLGLGLYIVRLVAAAHGGAVTARNLPGGAGVEFRIRLPAGTA